MISQVSRPDYCPEFARTALKIVALLKERGINATPFHSPSLPLFSSLPQETQSTQLMRLRVNLESLQVEGLVGIDAQKKSLWSALKAFGLVPPSDLFSHFTDGDMIELYDLFGTQIWRNPDFFRFTSYTLEELHVLDWPTMYSRAPEKQAECYAKMGQLLSGEGPSLLFNSIAEHPLTETNSQHKLILHTQHTWGCRLVDISGRVSAVVITSAVRLGGTK